MKSLHELIATAERDKPYEIGISGSIGRDISSRAIFEELQLAAGRPVVFTINSAGGWTAAAIAIFHLIRGYAGATEARIIRAMSAASVIALACDRRVIHADGAVMYHRSRNVYVGDRRQQAAAAEQFREIDALMSTLVTDRTGLAEAQIDAIDGQWLNPSRCVELGIAHAISGPSYAPRSVWVEHEPTRELLLERGGMLQGRLDGLLESDTAKVDALRSDDEVTIAAKLDTRYPVGPPSMIDVSHLQRAEVDQLVADSHEVKRRLIEILHADLHNTRSAIRAIDAGVAQPVAMPLTWSCAVCGGPNFHAHADSTGMTPTPCAHCPQPTPGRAIR